MQRWWIAVGVGVVGVALALLLIDMPDTGDEVPEYVARDVEVADPGPGAQTAADTPTTRPAEPAAVDRDGAAVATPATATPPEGTRVRPGATYIPPEAGNGRVNTVAAERRRLLDEMPEGQASAKVTAPLNEIARQASMIDDADLADRATQLSRDVLDWRREPDLDTWNELEVAQRQLIRDLRASGLAASNPSVGESADRLHEVLAELRTIVEDGSP